MMRIFFILISNIKTSLKLRPVHRECTKKAKTSRNQSSMINQHRKGETRKKGKTKHHSRRVKKKKDLNSRMDRSRPSKLLEFRSRQIHHIKQCSTNLQITVLRCRLKLQDQQSNKSTTLCGITQQTPNNQKIILHISKAIGQ